MTGSEFFVFINMEKMPTIQEIKERFTHLDITDDIKALRWQYRLNLKKSGKWPVSQSIDKTKK